MNFVSLLVSLVEITGKNYNFELTDQVRKNIKQLIAKETDVQLYTLAKFLSLCHDASDLRTLINEKASAQPANSAQLDLKEVIRSNQVIQRYPLVNQAKLEAAISITIDLQNHGFQE